MIDLQVNGSQPAKAAGYGFLPWSFCLIIRWSFL
jgi:hypothetical protein